MRGWSARTLYGFRRPVPFGDWKDLHPRQLYAVLRQYTMWVVSYFVTNAIVTTLVSVVMALLLYLTFRRHFITHASATSSDVLSGTLQKENVMIQAQALSKAIVDRILADPKSSVMVTQLLVKVLQQPQTKDQSVKILRAVFQEDVVRQTTAAFFGDLILSPAVQERARVLGRNATGSVLQAEGPRAWLGALFRTTLGSDDMQRHIGDALWKATWFSLRPGIPGLGPPATAPSDESGSAPPEPTVSPPDKDDSPGGHPQDTQDTPTLQTEAERGDPHPSPGGDAAP